MTVAAEDRRRDEGGADFHLTDVLSESLAADLVQLPLQGLAAGNGPVGEAGIWFRPEKRGALGGGYRRGNSLPDRCGMGRDLIADVRQHPERERAVEACRVADPALG